MNSARFGFDGDLDLGYGALKLLRSVGLVWDLREPPDALRAAPETAPYARPQERHRRL
jgi:hypothetical protein